MKICMISRLAGGLLAAWLLAGCTSTPMNRIDANRSLYDSWPVEARQAVLDGRVEKGMTAEMVEMSIGKPSQKETRPGRQGADEVWIYGGSGSNPLKGANIGVGVGPVYVGGLGGGSGASTAEYREVVFQNGVVVSGDDRL